MLYKQGITRGSQALRQGRVSIPNQIYLITTVTKERQPLFNKLINARTVINVMKDMYECKKVNSLAFVIMPDHVHWLLQLNHTYPLDQVMKQFKGRTSRLLNIENQNRGVIWQQGYHDRAIRKDEEIKSVARYLVANPLRAGIIDKIENYSHWDAIWLDGSSGH